MAKGVNNFSPGGFGITLAIGVAVILAFIGIVHGAARMAEKHDAFVKKCDEDGGVVIPSRNGEICIPKWIIYGEKK